MQESIDNQFQKILKVSQDEQEDGPLQSATDPQRPGFFKYQLNWSEDYEAEADLLFVVEGHSLPAHSAVLADSDFVLHYLGSSDQEGPVEVKELFWDVNLEAVAGFLCLIYPNAENDQLYKHHPGVLAVARKLGCQNVIEAIEAFRASRETELREKRNVLDVMKSVCSNTVVQSIAVGAAVTVGPQILKWIKKNNRRKSIEKKMVEKD